MEDKTRLRLLIVEDNPADAELVRARLTEVRGRAFDIRQARTAAEAEYLLLAEAVDAVLLDLDLSDSEGIETVRRIRTVNQRVPVVVLSGHDDESIREAALEAGAQDYIGKDEPAARLLARSILYAVDRYRAHEHQREIEKVLAATPDAVIVTDGHGLVRFVNDAAEELFGRNREDFVGDLLGFSVAEGTTSEIEVLCGDQVRSAEMRIVDVDWYGQPAYLAAIRDTTETRRIATRLQQSQKLEAIGRLAGGVAHDFNNLLTVIVTYAGFVREQLRAADPRREDIDEVLRAAERARELTSQLLAFSRRQPIETRVVELNDLLQDAHRMLHRTLGEDVEVVVIPREDVGYVKADAGQLEQVLMNLAVNARDAMPNGGKLTIEMDNVERQMPSESLPEGEYVVIRVRDTGIGMDDAVRAKMFEPFFTTKEKGKGTGLGLATCYGIVRQMGGDITVETELGRGTVFEVWLPRTAELPQSRAPRDVVSPFELGGDETVLVVEDDGAIRRSTVRILRDRGYCVIAASNGAEALRVLSNGDQAEAVDLVVTDLVMPQMGGRELVERLSSGFSNLRALFVTGYTADGALPSELPGVELDILYKPFMAGTLLTRVRKLLDRDRGQPS